MARSITNVRRVVRLNPNRASSTNVSYQENGRDRASLTSTSAPTKSRPVPIGFQSRGQLSLTDNRYKIYSSNEGKSYKLFDLIADPGEKADLAGEKPEVVAKMKVQLDAWVLSCKDSLGGGDYR